MTELHPHSSCFWVVVWAELCLSAKIREFEIGPQNWGNKGSSEESICQWLSISNHSGATSRPVRRLATAFPPGCVPTLSLLHVMVSDKELEGLARPLVSDFPPASDCTMATVLSLWSLSHGLWRAADRLVT